MISCVFESGNYSSNKICDNSRVYILQRLVATEYCVDENETARSIPNGIYPAYATMVRRGYHINGKSLSAVERPCANGNWFQPLDTMRQWKQLEPNFLRLQLTRIMYSKELMPG